MAPRSHSRSPRSSRSRSKSRSRSRTPRKRSYSRSRSRSRSPPPRRRSYSRSRSRSRSRSPYQSKRRDSRDRSRSRSPMSSRKRHVGNREDPPAGKCLGVFGLSLYTTEREVRDMFERYGRVGDARIVHDHATGRSRGFAFVNMESVNGAQDAKERLNGAELDGRRIRVDYSITQRAHTPTPGVYMGRPTSKGDGYRGSRSSGGGGRYRGGGGGGSRYGGSSRRSYSRSRSRSPYHR